MSYIVEDNVIRSAKQSGKIQAICQPLFDESPMSFFGFSRIFDDGKSVDLSTSPEWMQLYYENRFHETCMSDRIKVGINFLSRSTNKEITKEEDLSSQMLDITNRLDLVRRHNGYFDMFVFGTSNKNIDQASHFYVYHQEKILKFCSYFDFKGSDLIAKGYEYKITLPKYECPSYKLERFYDQEMGLLGHELSLSSKGFVCLLLYAYGYTHKQTANMMHLSTKTIEYYIAEIKNKTGIITRSDAMSIIKNNNWQDLIGFFFNYIHKKS